MYEFPNRDINIKKLKKERRRKKKKKFKKGIPPPPPPYHTDCVTRHGLTRTLHCRRNRGHTTVNLRSITYQFITI